jgi:hypothetical protein
MAVNPCLSHLAFVGLLSVLPGGPVPDSPRPAPEPRAPPNGFYLVLRQGAKPGDVGPARAGERLVVNRHPYEKAEDRGPPRYLAVHRVPDVPLALKEGPEGTKDDSGSLRIRFRLAPEAARKLERLTRGHQGGEVAVILGGEVVTAHKIRSVIADGRVQITCCAPGSCEFLLKSLQQAVAKK